MCSSPGFQKTHEYGTPFGDQESAEAVGTVSSDDENWAGPAFTKPYTEPE